MKFNLLINSYITSSGTVSMTVEDMINILSVSGTVNISGNDSVYIDCDLVDRIGIDEIRYYFDSTTNSGTIVSGIFFSYKNDLADGYSNLATNLGNGYYYSNVPSLSAPRYIKMVHTIASGTSISGTIKGFEVLNNDDIVNFGSDGLLESTTVLTSLNYLNYQNYIKEIQIYNNGPSVATAHVFIDPQNNDTDELLSISASEDGPWVFARNVNYVIVNGDNWAAGQYNNTNTSDIADGKLRLDSDKTVGTYTTPIFRNDSVKFAYIDVLQTAVSGSIVAVDSDDYTSTIQIRSSSSKPIDYNVYRKLYYAGVSYQNQFWYKDFLTATDTEVYDSYDATGTMFGASWGYYSYTYNFDCTQFVIDEDTQKTAFISVTGRGAAPNTGVYTIDLMILSQNGVQLEYKRLAYAGYHIGYLPYRSILYNMRFDSEGGIWLYNYTNFTANSYNLTDVLDDSHAISEEGYWLLHLDSDLNILYNSGVGSSNLVVGECAPVIGDTSLWYCTKQGTQAVIKLTSSGTVGFSYEYVTDLKGLCSTDDGGCWFIDNDDLHKLNSSGGLEDSIINIDIGSELTFVAFDSEDVNYLWIVDGVYIKRIRLDGTVFRSIYLEGFTINRLLTTSEGLWVYCTEGETGDNYAKYIGKLSSGVEKTIECVTDAGEGDPSDVGIKSVSYDNLSLGNLIPLSDDTIWNDDLEWNKAVTVNAVLPREEYNQFKLTLRRSNVSIDLPTVENIYYQDSVELTDTYPGQSETLYLRISLPDGVTIGGDYASNLRVWWELAAP